VPLVTACLVIAGVFAGASDALAQRSLAPQQFTVSPITITSVTVENGQLWANGLLGSNPFKTTLGITPEFTGEACPILNLQLGPIDLTLLGLNVLTSPICLDVHAIDGGGLLGDLLCSIAGALSQGVPLADVLTGLTQSGELSHFLNGLTSLLDQTLDQVTNSANLAEATCSVLSLAIGPINLDLLGLVVNLDDCGGGPVTLDITAIPGGGLLGDLLCNLGRLLDRNSAEAVIRQSLWQISKEVARLEN